MIGAVGIEEREAKKNALEDFGMVKKGFDFDMTLVSILFIIYVETADFFNLLYTGIPF